MSDAENNRFTVSTEPLLRTPKYLSGRPQRPTFICLEGPQTGMRLSVDRPEVIMGRNTNCDLPISDDMVSRRHARVTYSNHMDVYAVPECTIEDLGSMNGTEINGERLQSVHTLNEGDRITLGCTTMGYFVRDEQEFLTDQLLYEMATHDALTGLDNRHQFMTHLDHHVARVQRRSQPLSLLVVDADNFKAVNDRYGHDVGDQVLIHMASLLKRQVRTTDLCARWGGEELVVLLPDSGLDAAAVLAERIREASESTSYQSEEGAIPLTLSIGIAELEPGESTRSLFRRADMNLLAAKRGGRNRVVS